MALADAGALRGRVLDVDCETSEHAIMAAGLGLAATGVDLAANALRAAEEKARVSGRAVRLLRHDAGQLGELGERFDTVVDRGLLHRFDGDDRAAYVQALKAVVPRGGRYFMLGFSDRQRGEWGGCTS